MESTDTFSLPRHRVIFHPDCVSKLPDEVNGKERTTKTFPRYLWTRLLAFLDAV